MIALHQKSERGCQLLAVILAFMIPISTTATHIVLSAIVLLWFFSGNLSHKTQIIIQHPVSSPIFVLFSIFIVGAFYTIAPKEDCVGMFSKMSKILYLPFLIPFYKKEKWRYRAIQAFIAAMLLTLLLSFLKVYAGLPINSRHSLECVFKNHIDTSLMMSAATFFIAHYTVLHPNRWIKNVGFILIALLTFYIFCINHGRAGYIIFTSLWILFLVQRFSLKSILGGVGILSLILGTVSLNAKEFKHRIDMISEDLEHYQIEDKKTETSIGARMNFIKYSLELSKEHPWVGRGTGSFKSAYATLAKARGTLPTTNPHNEYLNMLVQWGIVGLSALLALFWRIFKTSLSLPCPERYWAQGVLIAIMIASCSNTSIMDVTSGHFFVTLIAIACGAFYRPDKQSCHPI